MRKPVASYELRVASCEPGVKTRNPQLAIRNGTVLGFDFGEKRIGVAVGDLPPGIAHPLATVQWANPRQGFEAIAALVKEWQPVLLVVGAPSHPDGAEHAVGRLCRRFSERLRDRFGLPAVLVDERLTSAAAAESLREAGVSGKKQKSALDQVAAQHILQAYFDQRHDAAA